MSSSASSSLGFGTFLSGGSSISLSEYSLATNLNADEVAQNFQKMLTELRTVGPARDPSSVRKAVCCSALIETAMEEQRRRNSHGGTTSAKNANDNGITPNEMFIVTITALTSLQTSLEARQKSLSSSSTTTMNFSNDATLESISLELQNTALPLLEILRRTLPYVSHHTNNHGLLLLHQFGSLSRMMRMFVALGYALPATAAAASSTNYSVGDGKKRKRNQSSSSSGSGGDGSSALAGANALLRQILKVSTSLLLVTPPVNHNNSNIVSEKDLAKLLHTTIVPMFHDVRPKVRKAAWGCGMEIIVVASSSSSSGPDDDAMMQQQQQQRKVIADFLWEYCHAVITNYVPSSVSSKDKSSKVIHVLRFLSAALPYADDERIRIRFGECSLTMLTGGGDGGGGSVPGEVGKEILVTLLSCLEMTDHEQKLREDDIMLGPTTNPNENMPKFAAKALTFLLQHRPNSSNNSSNDWQDMNVMYGRCILACMEGMMNMTSSNKDDGERDDDVPAPKLLAMKLFPSVLGSMIHLCEGGSTGSARDGDGGIERNNHLDTCGSEFNQLISRMIPVIIPYLDKQANATLHRVTFEILPQCVPIIQQALQLKYRSSWGSILSGGYSTFTSTIARKLLEIRASSSNTGGNGSKDIADLENKLSSWVQTLVLSLLRLHEDVARGDGTARTAVEYATSTIIREIGVELFLSMVDFLNDSDKKTLSSSSGIRDDRAWLLPLMKQCTDSSRRSTTIDDCTTLKTHLTFFQGYVLNLARKCDAATADGHRTAAEISIHKARVVELWSLFPSFCVYPIDMKENFESVSKTVLKAIGDYGRYPALIVSTFCSMV